jgi:hypothetical protein
MIVAILVLVGTIALGGFGLYLILRGVSRVAPNVAAKTLEDTQNAPGIGEGFSKAVIDPLGTRISKVIRLRQERHDVMAAMLNRLRIDRTPEEYIGSFIAKSIIIGLVSLVFIPLGLAWAVLLLVFYAVLYTAKGITDLDSKIEALNGQLEYELPYMLSFLKNNQKTRPNPVDFFRDYRVIASRRMKNEIDWVLFKISAGEEPLMVLQDFDLRLRIPIYTQFIGILGNIFEGIPCSDAMDNLREVLHIRKAEKLRRETMEGPDKGNGPMAVLLFAFVAFLFVGMFISIQNGIGVAL